MKKVVLLLMVMFGTVAFGCKDPDVREYGVIMEGQYNAKGEPMFRVEPGIQVVEYRYPDGYTIKIVTNVGTDFVLPDQSRVWGDSRVILWDYVDNNGDYCMGYMDIYGKHIKSVYDN